MQVRTLFGFLTASLAISSSAVAADSKCTDPEYGRFAFLEGEWDVIWVAKEQIVGRYSIEEVGGRCGLLVKWKGAPATPGEGATLISYSPAKGYWQRFFVDDTGAWELATVKGAEGKLVWEGERSDPDDNRKTMRVRITWEKTADGMLEGYDRSNDGSNWRPWGRFRLQRPA